MIDRSKISLIYRYCYLCGSKHTEEHFINKICIECGKAVARIKLKDSSIFLSK